MVTRSYERLKSPTRHLTRNTASISIDAFDHYTQTTEDELFGTFGSKRSKHSTLEITHQHNHVILSGVID